MNAFPLPRWVNSVDARIEGQLTHVTARTHGRNARVLATPGQLVERGQLLFALDGRALDRAAEEAAAELDVAMSLTHQGLVRPMLARVVVPPSPELTRARRRFLATQMRRALLEGRADSAGRVLQVRARVGEPVEGSRPLVTILDSDDVWVLARFGAEEFSRLRVGLAASVRVGSAVRIARITTLASPDEPALLEFIARPVGELLPGASASVAVAALAHF
jgi:multidrug resistance efflux pump